MGEAPRVPSRRFEELDRRETAMGVISLRRRLDPILDTDVFEVKLDDDHLMSSVFTAGEIALATLGLGALPADGGIDVIVGGLGLGYTAKAVLDDDRVRTLDVVEALDAVIEWHRLGLVPNGVELEGDARCAFVTGDFFELMAGTEPIGSRGGPRVHAVLVDIDHTPSHHLAPSHAAFYSVEGLERVARRLHPGGVFGLWSDRGVDESFLATLGRVFPGATAHEVRYPNHHTGDTAADTVYVATSPPA